MITENYSLNPLTGIKHALPGNNDDRENLLLFLEKNKGKKVVVVQGLGFVGAVMALVVANALEEEYAVIGIDLPSKSSFWKIKSINEGLFPVVAADPKIDVFYQKSREKDNFYATFDPFCYSLADVVVVDINLDVQKKTGSQGALEGFDVDLSAFKKAIESIATNCKEDVLVLVETTVPPGSCIKVVKPILENYFNKRGLNKNYKLAHSYERVMPGPKYIDSIQNFYRVYSGIDKRSADAAEVFLKTVIKTDEYPLTRLGTTTATEMAKVLENSFRAMNIAFMVEWSRFAEEADVNIWEVVNAIRMRPTHKNIMLPGIGVGGYCLTKDPLLASWARQNLFDSTEPLGQSERGVAINDRMPFFAFSFLKRYFLGDLAGKKVLLLGVSYLNDVGDTRYTPVELLHSSLEEAGCELVLHDPHVRFWEEKSLNVEADLSAVFKGNFDLVVLSTGHKEYRSNPDLIQKLLTKKSLFLLDTIGVFSEEEIAILQQKHTVKVLGRGDL